MIKSWDDFISNEKNKSYFKNIEQRIELDLNKGLTIFPPKDEIFNAFKLTPLNCVKVVIIGQDPYHGEHQANGLAFSVNKGVKTPPSLKNIFKEIKNCYPDFIIPEHGDLTNWAKQGVLLLNNSFTVIKKTPNSHSKIGWDYFTNNVITFLSDNYEKIIFVLWGNFAISKEVHINKQRHYILKSPHPSPFSAHNGFLGNNHFKTINNILENNNKSIINWNL